jgi:Cu/Ag efflux pump CusA
MQKEQKKLDKEFGLSSWAINNKTTIYVMISLILILGISAYNSMPREDFPEIKETKIYISSIYPGNTAEDVEKLITGPIEDKIKTVSNVVEVTSNSQEDYSMIIVEFDENISVDILRSKAIGSTFAPLKVGQSSLAVSPSISSLTFCFAWSTEMFSSNSTIIIE